jgi:hypothetical protein
MKEQQRQIARTIKRINKLLPTSSPQGSLKKRSPNEGNPGGRGISGNPGGKRGVGIALPLGMLFVGSQVEFMAELHRGEQKKPTGGHSICMVSLKGNEEIETLTHPPF